MRPPAPTCLRMRFGRGTMAWRVSRAVRVHDAPAACRIDSPGPATDSAPRERPMGASVAPRCAVRRGALRRIAVVCAVVLAPAVATARDAVGPRPPGLSRIQGPLPTTAPDLLLLADSLVRAGRVPDARILLRHVVAQFPGTAWANWGELGLGFLALARGRMADARPHYEAAVAGGFEDTARVVLALLDAQDGNTAEAAAVLDAIARDASRRSTVREAAGLGAAYARFWAGDWAGAALAFAAVADAHPTGPLADDALYGLAQAFRQLGDPTSAEQVLERASAMPAQGFDDEHVRPALRNLGFREILRATRTRYEGTPFGQADQMLVALLDVNGRALAVGSLALLAEQAGQGAPGTSLGDAARNAAAFLARRRAGSGASGAAATAPSAPRRSGSDRSAAHVGRPAPDAPETPAGAPPARGHEAPTAAAGWRALGWLALLAGLAALGLRVVLRRRRTMPRPGGTAPGGGPLPAK